MEYRITPQFHAQSVRNIINRVMVEAGLFGPVWGRAMDAFANIDLAYEADCAEGK